MDGQGEGVEHFGGKSGREESCFVLGGGAVQTWHSHEAGVEGAPWKIFLQLSIML